MKRLLLLFLLLISLVNIYSQDFRTNIVKFTSTGLDSDSGADFIDWDGDGKLDVVCGYEIHKEMMVLRNDEVTSTYTIVSDSCMGYNYFKRVDINFDGFDDFVAGVHSTSGFEEVYLYINDGNYNYSSVSIFNAGYDQIEMIEIADMDNDGDLDMVVDILANANFFFLLTNNGNNNYSWSYIDFIGQPAELYAVVDLNNDSLPDVIGAYYNFSVNDFIVIAAENDLPNSGDFFIHPIDTIDQTWEGIVANFIGSELPDIMVSPVTGVTQAALWRNDGNFSFTLAALPTVQNYTRLYLPNDYDGDGDMDALTYGINGIEILKNNGNGNFSNQSMIGSYSSPPVAWDDYNGDGLNDILMNGGSLVGIYLQNINGGYDQFWITADGASDVLAVIDTDQNGKPDILATEGSEFRNIKQSFDEKLLPTEIYTPSGLTVTYNEVHEIIPFDKDQDGDMDMLATYENNLFVLTNNNGIFSASTLGSGLSSPSAIKMGDLDMDNNPDFIIRCASSYARFELTGSSLLQFTALPVNSVQFEFADADLDGDKDIVYLNWNISSQVTELKYLKNTNNSFSDEFIMDMTGIVGSGATSNDSKMAAADLDQDGDDDIFLLSYGEGKIVWMRNDSNLIFTPVILSTNISTPNNIEITDTDLDGDNDIIISSINTGKIYLLSNDGSENFTSSVITNQAAMPKRMKLTDFDGDGDQDIITISQKDYKTLWIENLTLDCPRTYNTLSEIICPEDSIMFGSNYINTVGFYYDTLTNYAGCDSIIRMQLDLYALPQIIITNNNNLLSVNQGFAQYQWFRNDTLIPGETAATLDTELYGSGSYYVSIITNDGCNEASDIVEVEVVGINITESENNGIEIFPNPVGDYFIIDSKFNNINPEDVRLFTSSGIVLSSTYYQITSNNEDLRINFIKDYSGLILISIQLENRIIIKKIIKQ